MPELLNGLTQCFEFYNTSRPHQSLAYKTPDQVYLTAQGGSACIVNKLVPPESHHFKTTPNKPTFFGDLLFFLCPTRALPVLSAFSSTTVLQTHGIISGRLILAISLLINGT